MSLADGNHSNYQQSLPFLKRYRQNSLPSNSNEMRRIRAAARENGIYVSLGYSEIDMATLYLAQVLISPTGDVLNHRRKIKPTHVERLIFGDGAGDTFEPVVDTDIGRIGQLNCWENLNPFLKAYAASLGEQVHVAAWPIYPDKTTLQYPDPYTNISDGNSDIVSPAYAIETGTFVLAPFQRISQEGVAKNTPPGVEVETPDRYNGHTRIFGPDGALLAKPDKDFEGLTLVDVSFPPQTPKENLSTSNFNPSSPQQIDLDEAHLPKALADLGGHYMRPDLMRLLVDTRRKELITHADTDGNIGTYSTMERVGLATSLSGAKPDVLPMRKIVPRTREAVEGNGWEKVGGVNGGGE